MSRVVARAPTRRPMFSSAFFMPARPQTQGADALQQNVEALRQTSLLVPGPSVNVGLGVLHPQRRRGYAAVLVAVRAGLRARGGSEHIYIGKAAPVLAF